MLGRTELGLKVGELSRAAYAPRDALNASASYNGFEPRKREDVDAEAEDHAGDSNVEEGCKARIKTPAGMTR
jgi:hypothetical protein